MSKDSESSKRDKKSKKDKKVDLSAGQPTQSESIDRAEKKKKDKKKKRRDSSKDEEPAQVDIGPSVTVADQSSEKERSGKKSKKKSSKGDNSQPGSVEQVAIDIDTSDTTIEGTKDRKRKRHPEGDTNTEEQSPPKKQKKGKRDKQVEYGSHAQPSTSTTSSEGTPALPPPAQIAITPTDSTAASAFLTKHSITIHTPPSLLPVIPVISFDQLQVPEALKVAFKDFKEPTPIQACAWPPALQGHDVVGIAETGSGKTLAFGIPALARLICAPSLDGAKSKKSKSKSTHSVTVLVVAPTRELALQTHDSLSTLGAPFNIASVAVFGGVDKAPQINALRNENKDGKVTRIVVGTPGRILDLVNEGACDLSRVNYLVLDEADRMLDKGFENDIRKIISFTMQGADRQTMMFSATWPEAVRRLAGTFQRNPVRVTVGSDDLTANSHVEQIVEVFDDPREKDARLAKTLKTLAHKKTSTKGSPEARILVFALYKKEASRVESTLRKQGYTVGALHGDLSQSARMDALEKFKTGETGLLVATDVAARGLDIPNVGAVINYTFPLTIEDYIHRIGRTGGRSGKSITFFTGENHERALAGELARVLRDSHFDEMAERLQKFPMTIKKKTHGSYGAFFRDDIAGTATKIVFD
ncbi:DEAD-domain-containing protein [Imleria badia]|nr:DEAD-domain-containing protein [Imleria badia]